MDALFGLLGVIGFLVGIVMLVIALIRKKPKKTAGIVTGVGFSFIFIGFSLAPEEVEKADEKTEVSSDEVDEDKKDANEDAEKKKKEAERKKQLEFEGTMKTTASEGKVAVEIVTNVPDGAIFEVMVMDGNLNMKSDFIEAKDGKVSKSFEIPSDWEPAHFASTAMFRFNLEEHPQPDNIKEIYGEVGEKMTGDLVDENNLDGKNATIEGNTVAYPSEEVVQASMDEKFNQAISEMKELSEGIIIDVRKKYDDWMIVDVVVSDSWYYSPDHEKERFAEQIGETVQNLVNNSGKQDGSISVYFVDSYGSELASPKMLGGWKIKK